MSRRARSRPARTGARGGASRRRGCRVPRRTTMRGSRVAGAGRRETQGSGGAGGPALGRLSGIPPDAAPLTSLFTGTFLAVPRRPPSEPAWRRCRTCSLSLIWGAGVRAAPPASNSAPQRSSGCGCAKKNTRMSDQRESPK